MRVISRICGNESQPGVQLVEKLAILFLSVKGFLNVRVHPKNVDWPFTASHSRGTTLPYWKEKDALGQDKQKPYIMYNGNFLCGSCPSTCLFLY